MVCKKEAEKEYMIPSIPFFSYWTELEKRKLWVRGKKRIHECPLIFVASHPMRLAGRRQPDCQPFQPLRVPSMPTVILTQSSLRFQAHIPPWGRRREDVRKTADTERRASISPPTLQKRTWGHLAHTRTHGAAGWAVALCSIAFLQITISRLSFPAEPGNFLSDKAAPNVPVTCLSPLTSVGSWSCSTCAQSRAVDAN